MPIDYIPDPTPPPPLPKGHAHWIPVKYYTIPFFAITLVISLYAVTQKTQLFTFAKKSVSCPTYFISATGQFTSDNPNRRVQISLNGTPIGNFISKSQLLSLPPEGLHSWQVIDNYNCLSSGSYSLHLPQSSDPILAPSLIPTYNP